MMKSPTDNNQRPNIINLKSPVGNAITEKANAQLVIFGIKMKSIVYGLGHEYFFWGVGGNIYVEEWGGKSFTTLLSLIF